MNHRKKSILGLEWRAIPSNRTDTEALSSPVRDLAEFPKKDEIEVDGFLSVTEDSCCLTFRVRSKQALRSLYLLVTVDGH